MEPKWGVMLRVVLAASTILALGGCTVGPNFAVPSWASPKSWFAGPRETVPPEPSQPVAAPVDPNWWTLFHDNELTALERRVAAENLDVRVATTRLAESRAQLGQARAPEFPTFNANGSYTRQKASNEGPFATNIAAVGANGASGNNPGALKTFELHPFDVYQVGFDASWRLDLWGSVSRSVEAASASVAAAEEFRRATLLSSLAEVARDYIALRGVQTQLRIARDNVRTAEQSLQLTQQRAAGGVTTDLDVANASAQLRSTMAQIPGLEQQEAAGHQRTEFAAGAAAERVARRIGRGAAGAAGAAARPGRGCRPNWHAVAPTWCRPRRNCTPQPPISASRWRRSTPR